MTDDALGEEVIIPEMEESEEEGDAEEQVRGQSLVPIQYWQLLNHCSSMIKMISEMLICYLLLHCL